MTKKNETKKILNLGSSTTFVLTHLNNLLGFTVVKSNCFQPCIGQDVLELQPAGDLYNVSNIYTLIFVNGLIFVTA